jgi:hypothetical protein
MQLTSLVTTLDGADSSSSSLVKGHWPHKKHVRIAPGITNQPKNKNLQKEKKLISNVMENSARMKRNRRVS